MSFFFVLLAKYLLAKWIALQLWDQGVGLAILIRKLGINLKLCWFVLERFILVPMLVPEKVLFNFIYNSFTLIKKINKSKENFK